MNNKNGVWTGGCLCGAWRYELEGEPPHSGYCHRNMCKRATGGAFAVLMQARRDKRRWTRGQPAVYRSSPIATRGFCPNTAAHCFSNMTTTILSGNRRLSRSTRRRSTGRALRRRKPCFLGRRWGRASRGRNQGKILGTAGSRRRAWRAMHLFTLGRRKKPAIASMGRSWAKPMTTRESFRAWQSLSIFEPIGRRHFGRSMTNAMR